MRKNVKSVLDVRCGIAAIKKQLILEAWWP